MITLRRLNVLLLVMHIAMAFVAGTKAYFDGYLSDHGVSGWLAFTPLSAHFDLESSVSGARDVSLANVPGMFRFLFDLGDSVNSLASFDYPHLAAITTANFLFVLVLALRGFSLVVWFASAGALIKTALDSNMLSSKVGLAVLFGGIGILSALGIFF